MYVILKNLYANIYPKEGKRGCGGCENVYNFRAKYCCKDVSWLAARPQFGPEAMSIQNGGGR